MWRYSYEIGGAILIVLSSVVSETMPKEWRIRIWAGFVVLALLYMSVGIHLAKQGEVEQGKRDAAIQELQHKFDQSVLEQARMTGQLTAMKEIMGNLSQTGLPGFKEFATAVTGIVRADAQRAADAETTDKQLCDRTMDLVKRLRVFQDKFEEARSNIYRAEPILTNPDERHAEHVKEMQAIQKQYQEQDAQFRSQFLGDAKYLKDLMFSKLPMQKRDALVLNNGQSETTLSVGTAVGANDEYHLANYLEEIAKTLCPEKLKK